MDEVSSGELFVAFCNHEPELGLRVTDYRLWGKASIVVWLDNGQAYKVKMLDPDRFIVQRVSQEDIERKFGKEEAK